MHRTAGLLLSTACVASSHALRAVGASVASTVAHAAADHAHAHAAAQHLSPGDDRSVFGWWEVIVHGSRAELLSLLSPRWWAQYIAAEFEKEPAHVIVEVACILTILYLLVLRKPAPLSAKEGKLTLKEEEELIAEWKPEPLCPPLAKTMKTRFIVEGPTGRTVRANGKEYLNFASTNFLGLGDKAEIKRACRETIDKYGVGSCGPRGFYGTFDVHLDIEASLAKFLGAEECILYSDSIACVSSVIPAFAKKGDVIVVDESATFAIQQGCLLSRSDIHYFRHNDVAHLEQVLKAVDAKELATAKKHGRSSRPSVPLHRKFIVLEGVSAIDGAIAPLPEIVALKDKFKYRIIVEDSLGFGVLGATGKGTVEHHGLDMSDVDAVCAAMDGALGSVGGFCCGSHQVVDHQRLSGAGYCFSASSPPYTSVASLLALDMMDKHPELGAAVRAKAARTRKALASVHRRLIVLGGADSATSPVIHLALADGAPPQAGVPPPQAERDLMESFLTHLIAGGIAASVPEFIPADKAARRATVRLILAATHTDADLDMLVQAVSKAAKAVL